MQAAEFNGYQSLKMVDIPKPSPSEGTVLVRVTAAGVTPLDRTILMGHFPMSNAPLVMGTEGAGVIEEGGDALFPNGARVMTTLGYSADRMTTINLTDLLWKEASIRSFILFTQPLSMWTEAWAAIASLLQTGKIKPVVAKTFALSEAAEALRFLVEDRPFGRVVVTT
jgi:NADPH2:quinone reductase